MQIDLTLRRLIPFSVEEKISSVTQFFDPLCVEFLSVGNSKGMVITNVFFGKPIGNLVLVIVLDIPSELKMSPVDLRAAALLTSFVQVSLSCRCRWKSFQYEQASKT